MPVTHIENFLLFLKLRNQLIGMVGTAHKGAGHGKGKAQIIRDLLVPGKLFGGDEFLNVETTARRFQVLANGNRITVSIMQVV